LMTYSEQFTQWLQDEGYTHCFFVAGGNIMHLLNAVRTRLVCIPVVHEVAAGIAAEYFNEVSGSKNRRAFALVTAGPGVTNVITAVAGAYAESRELLVVGGQVKSSDLASSGLRQRGIQEIDGMAVMAPLCVAVAQLQVPAPRAEIERLVRRGAEDRKGPVYIEFCLNAQAAHELTGQAAQSSPSGKNDQVARPLDLQQIAKIEIEIATSRRPVLLLGGGVSRAIAQVCRELVGSSGLPIMTTWNGADRADSTGENYWGRPNTWGMRSSNILLQQADLVIALGTRLGLQQTGFNWQGFAPVGRVIQIDVDPLELEKGHPRIDLPILGDANEAFPQMMRLAEKYTHRWDEWRQFGKMVRHLLPVRDTANVTAEGYLDPFAFGTLLSDAAGPDDVLVPSSSGGAYTSFMQTFAARDRQIVVSDKGMASMGYGLSGAIGAALADPTKTVLHIEGDGGFAQNLQELGTVRAQHLNIKSFIFCNEGYASIRMTQRNYFGGSYVGCDVATGLGLPNWPELFKAYDILCYSIDPADPFGAETMGLLDRPGPVAFLVPIDPEQTYFPKISSRVTPTGGMESNPLHLMSPALESPLEQMVMRYLPGNQRARLEPQ
jgi:acetolactate synthase-1/2/3 large subunit